MEFTKQQIRSKKRKNMAGIITLCLLLALGIFCLTGFVVEVLGNQVTNVEELPARDLQGKNIYYFEELTLLDTFGAVQDYPGYISSRDFLVSFTDGEGTLYYTAVRLGNTAEPYWAWTNYLEEGIGDGTVSGCFHFYEGGMGATVRKAFNDACEAYSDGELLAVTFYYDAKTPADCWSLDGSVILLVMGLLCSVPAVIGIVLLIKKRKKIGVPQPITQGDVMAEKFFRRCKTAQAWKYIVWVYFLGSILGIVLVVNNIIPMIFIALFSVSWLALLIYYYTAAYVNISKKLLDAAGITQDIIASDLIHADVVSEHFRCGNRVLLLRGCILPIRCAAWVYLYQQMNMGITTARQIILQTAEGKKVLIDITADDIDYFRELLNRNRDKFRPDLIIGYTTEAKKRYKELKKAYKAQR